MQNTLELDCGRQIAVRHSSRARHMRLAVDALGQVELVIPKRGSLRAGTAFANSQRRWIARQQDSRQAQANGLAERAALDSLGRPTRIPVHGQWIDVDWTGAGGHWSFAPRATSAALVRELKTLARKQAQASMDALTPKLGLAPKALTLRDQKTLWGSLSSRGRMSLNWRLVMAPPHVLHYVVAHELAHLRWRGHGPRFWSLVAQLDPEFETARTWLRQHGDSLRVLLA
ncbi:M48 family metallopeptidase [bacterium]|nr:M48 family metallopeptidase [bacterium]